MLSQKGVDLGKTRKSPISMLVVGHHLRWLNIARKCFLSQRRNDGKGKKFKVLERMDVEDLDETRLNGISSLYPFSPMIDGSLIILLLEHPH